MIAVIPPRIAALLAYRAMLKLFLSGVHQCQALSTKFSTFLPQNTCQILSLRIQREAKPAT